MLPLVLAAALAHPVGGAHFGHHLSVELTQDEVRVHYLAEVPALQLLDEWAAASPTATKEHLEQAKREELGIGLVIEADGVWLPTRIEADGPVDYGPDTVIIPVQLTATLPEGIDALRISNGNYPDNPALYWRQVRLSSDWTLRTEPPYLEAWRGDQTLRELVLAPRQTAAWRRLLAPAKLRRPTDPLGVRWWLWLVLGALLAGGAGWARSRSKRTGPPTSP